MAGAVLGSALGVAAAARLVAQAQAQPFVVRSADIGVVLASGRVGKKAPPLRLIDQHGDTVNLERFRGRPVIVTFGFGHCTTICPLSVQAARTAVRRLAGRGVALLVVTLDPWRDTPARLPYLAARWELEGDMHVLSGAEAAVERALSAWRVPRARSLATGDITHPALVYVVDSRGELAYALGADPDAVVAAVGMLSSSGETPTLP
jgi:protein SCO1/2